MAIPDSQLQELAFNIAEVRLLLIKRRQIEQDGKSKGTYTKPTPHLTPFHDKPYTKKHKYDLSKNPNVRRITQEKLKENAKAIEKALHTYLKKEGLQELAKDYKEFKPKELVTFIEKGREQVLKDREKEAKQEKNKSEKTIDKVQNKFNKKIEEHKEQQIFDRLQEAFDKLRWDFKEDQMQENKKDIEQDRGYSR